MRRPLIAGNWKMYKTSAEAVDFVRRFLPLVSGVSGRDIMIAPAFTALEAVAAALKGTEVGLGAQDLFWEVEGAFTGQVSPRMLTAAGCRYVIIGHSERRQFFGETDDTVNCKVRAALAAGFIPVMCVGESEKQREAGQTFSILDKQVKDGLKSFVADELGSLVIAYEPVWAIGTGKTATAAQAEEAHAYIRSLVKGLFGAGPAGAVRAGAQQQAAYRRSVRRVEPDASPRARRRGDCFLPGSPGGGLARSWTALPSRSSARVQGAGTGGPVSEAARHAAARRRPATTRSGPGAPGRGAVERSASPCWAWLEKPGLRCRRAYYAVSGLISR